jgi:hypothetical protein
MSEVTLRETPLKFSSHLGENDAARDADTLNLIPYAEALRDFIHDCETPLTIGIQGDWGTGRTSLMNMLRGGENGAQYGLLDSSHCLAISFDSWPYAQFDHEGNLAIGCMSALTRNLGEALQQTRELDQEAIQTGLSAANHRLNIAMNQVRNLSHGSDVGSTDGAGFVDIPSQMLLFKAEFEKLVSLWSQSAENRRLVVFVDDLDRIRPSKALELLEAIKNFIDVPGCVFVMTLDYDLVQRGMAEKLGLDVQQTSGKAFYDKLVQLPFVVPTTSYKLEDYIVDLLLKSRVPNIHEIVEDSSSQKFFLEITNCTVGRNPRSIKRVINSTKLLERIHCHNAGRPTDDHEFKILFALVSMQVAWPELFQHLIRDPSVDNITSLQSWAYLDKLPEAANLFQRSPDKELVKNAISAYFDTLFSLLDENDDGQIDSRELRPVLDVMELAKITNIESRERPRDWFISLVRQNNGDNNPLIESFLDKVFMQSIWYLGTEIKYRKAGARYITLAHNRNQIGTLVSLKTQPLVIRLAMSPELVMLGLKEYWDSKHSVKSETISLVRNTFDKEASLTGYGDTLVDFSKMTNMPTSEAIKLLNALYRIVTS